MNNANNSLIAGRYKVLRSLGTGGTGAVFLVLDEKLNKKWALKLLSGRSDQEITALCNVSGGFFPRIVDTGTEGDRHYIVMDYVEGLPLYKYVRKHKCSIREITDLSIQLAEALDYLHNCSPAMLYLDCKPDNILIDNNGRLHLVDLGSIYLKDMAYPGRISGTKGYASPEQSHGQKVDITSDIYSYGKTLKKLFNGHDNATIRYVIRRCTNENPIHRFQSMSEVIDALQGRNIYARLSYMSRPTINTSIKSLFALFSIISCRTYVSTSDVIYLLLGIMLIILLFIPLFTRKELRNMKWICNKNIHMGRGLKLLILLATVAFAALLLGNTYSHAEERYLVTLYDAEGYKVLYKGQQTHVNNDGSVSVYIPPENVTPETLPVRAEYKIMW